MRKLTETEKAVEAAIDLELKNCEKDCKYFINEYVNIFDKDVPGIVIKFILWTTQIKVINKFLTKRLIIALKARQLGLTWLALAYALWRMLFTIGYTVIGLSKNDEDAKELVERIDFMLRHLPTWMVQNKDICPSDWQGIIWEVTAHEIRIYHHEGEKSEFVAKPASKEAGRSLTANLLLLDEWAFQQWAKYIYSAAYPTINRPTGGQVIGISTGKRGTLFEEIFVNALNKLNNFCAIFLAVWSDPRRTKEWYEQTKRDLPNTWRQEYPEKWQDAFTVGEGAFFPEWDEEVHVPFRRWEPPNDGRHPVLGGYDPAYSQACFKWYAVMPDGSLRCFREYYPKHATDSDQAKEILKRSVYYEDGNKPMKFEDIVADTDAWTPSRDSGKSTAEVFSEHGVHMSQAAKDLENGWRRLHEWLKPFKGKDGKETSMLTFTRDCPNTIKTYPACEQSETNPEDISKSTEHHCLIAGTMITTSEGKQPIENIKKGTYVLTSQGFKRVIGGGLTCLNAELITVVFSNGSILTGTKDHPVKVLGNGWFLLDSLQYEIIYTEDNYLVSVQGNAVHKVASYPAGIGAVYNLEVEDCPEYFACGILVHNCQDVDRYIVMSRPEPAATEKKKLKGQWTEDELEDKGLSKREIREMKERGQVI